ncbi:hypothetical protein [Pseudonocardia humida]|uniref:Excreted virulence factor EspC (Type VII ESX diderm) n=1 Tax=Pseudonocardia humida TaxID=2800819 RepID=A0ABT1A3H6_9PSEU|nr:hypothetical protein [Pseudonocardia humida]MCO1657419.1 hypothetical protein [Pseudonocardia humida]
MAPTPAQITVALDALRDDAELWDGGAEELRSAAGRAGAMALPPAAFSFAGQAVLASYEQLRIKVAALLTAGAANYDDIAIALRQSADAYESDEAAGAHRMAGVY